MIADLKFKTVTGANPVITLDGKKVRFKKNSFGNFETKLDVHDGARLKLTCWDTILSPLWLLWEMLYFVISFFGIFDLRKDKLKRTFEFEAVLHPTEADSKATVTVIRSNGEGSPAAELECNFEAEIVKNEYSGYEIIRKRRVIALVIKIAAWVALIASAIAVVATTMGE